MQTIENLQEKLNQLDIEMATLNQTITNFENQIQQLQMDRRNMSLEYRKYKRYLYCLQFEALVGKVEVGQLFYVPDDNHNYFAGMYVRFNGWNMRERISSFSIFSPDKSQSIGMKQDKLQKTHPGLSYTNIKAGDKKLYHLTDLTPDWSNYEIGDVEGWIKI